MKDKYIFYSILFYSYTTENAKKNTFLRVFYSCNVLYTVHGGHKSVYPAHAKVYFIGALTAITVPLYLLQLPGQIL